MMNKLIPGVFCMALISVLAFSGCEAGLTSNDDSGDGSDGKFSFSEMYTKMKAMDEEIGALKKSLAESTLLQANIKVLEEEIAALKKSPVSSSASDNFTVSTQGNTPNPNFNLSIGDGLGGTAHTPIMWNNMLILNGSGNTWCPSCGVNVDDNHRADMVIAANGNVGVGTVDPGVKLVVNGQVFSTNSPTGDGEFVLATKPGSPYTSPTWHIDTDDGADKFRIFRQPNVFTHGEVMMSIDREGNLVVKGRDILAEIDALKAK
ncbi:MAG: hypothetical protein GY754_40990 [bacterium]|nr:hypothetical protein [bacterium]